MKKAAVLWLAALLLVLSLPLCARAASQNAAFPVSSGPLAYIDDQAALLTREARLMLEEKAAALSARYRCDVRIVTVPDMAAHYYADIDDFADYLYETNRYGYGEDRNCVLLVLSMRGRDYRLLVMGREAEDAFTRYGIDAILDRDILPPLKMNDFAAAFTAYLDKAEQYFIMNERDRPFNVLTDPAYAGAKWAIVIALPLIIALIVCSAWKSGMKKARIAQTALNYIPEDGFKLTGRSDMFLYRTTTRRRIEKSGSSSSSHSGRSGSSGRSGKF
ncbi:MAG: TPM domain-containing protein [Clostridia bacterium]|nr:TPM domain-containing protein [Clostridia bacterium]